MKCFLVSSWQQAFFQVSTSDKTNATVAFMLVSLVAAAFNWKEAAGSECLRSVEERVFYLDNGKIDIHLGNEGLLFSI